MYKILIKQIYNSIICHKLLYKNYDTCVQLNYSITKEELQTLVDLPIWITHASLDETISVENSRNAYKTLNSLGGKVIYSEYKDVHYNGINYANHSSWIYVLNKYPVNENGEHIFQWLSHQKLE